MSPSIAEVTVREYQYLDTQRHEILPYLPDSVRRLLDVGCGYGGFGAFVRETRGAEVWGIEPNSGAAEQASRRLDHVIQATVEAASGVPDGSFDAVTFLDVLEHLVDPWAVLAAGRRWLRQGGIVVASVPNVRYWPVVKEYVYRGSWHYTTTGVLDRTHLRFFTRSSLGELFQEAGYAVQRIEGINAMRYRKLALLDFLLGGRLDEMRYMQLVGVGRPREK